jgi:lipopolysaccharide export system permease protein
VPTRDLLNPVRVPPRDRPKWIAEGHKRISAPLTTMSYAMVGLFSALGGMFRRHGGLVRPLVTVGVMVGLLAAGLAFGTLAARDNALIILMYLHAIVPGIVCFWLLMLPSLRSYQARRAGVFPQPSAA